MGDAIDRLTRVVVRSEWLGLLTMPLAVASVLFCWRERWARMAVAYLAFVLATWWLATHRIDRFLVPALPVVALLAGFGVNRLARVAGRNVMTGLVGVACLFALLVAVSGPAGDNRFFAPLDELREDSQRVMLWRLYLNQHGWRRALSFGAG